MRREEFITKVNELGLQIEETKNHYYVVNEEGKKLATIMRKGINNYHL